MRFYRDLQQIPSAIRQGGCVATIGNFDGVHRGHLCVFQHLQQQAKQFQLPSTVISFDPLPSEYFAAQHGKPLPTRIYPIRDKIQRLQAAGIDQFISIRFDTNFAGITAEHFIRDILLQTLKVRYLAVGDDFRFGYKRQGDFQLLRAIGEPNGMAVKDTQTCEHGEQRISSTRIRQALAEGDMLTANHLLGHAYQLSGRVRHGDKIGRTIGFPTLNMRLPDNVALRKGIYAVKVHGLGEQALLGAANVGKRPTVNGLDMRLETYLFDFNQQVYGKYVHVEPVAFIRSEVKFDSVDLMQQQIVQDCQHIQEHYA